MKKAIVTTYFPDEGGVSTYSKYFFQELKKIDKEIIVFAAKIGQRYKDKRVIPCWNKNLLFPFQILISTLKANVKVIHFQFEVHLFGSKLNLFTFPFLVFFLRLLKRKVIVTLHGVIPLTHFNKNFLKENGYSGNAKIVKVGLILIYYLICKFSSKIIVHDKKLKKYLKDYKINLNKVEVIPHGIKGNVSLIDRTEARNRIGISNKKYTFLYFGYITGYKGIELIIKALKKFKSNDFNFIIVGSQHPRLKDKISYQNYYKKIKDFFVKDPRCLFKGYIAENKVNYYFRASHCLVLPYSIHMSSSGPMALGISNEILVIGSTSFAGVLPKNLLFKRDANSLIKKMKEAMNSVLDKELNYILKLKREMNWEKVAKKTLEVYKN
ncbi:glycosyltransferase [Desulfonauticus submarinus]